MPVKARVAQRRREKHKEIAPVTHYADSRLDFPGPIALRNSYIVASAQRCGSTFLCNLLWHTGVLGAPAAYFQYRKRPTSKTLRDMMMERLEAKNPTDYVTKLLACRTSGNGVFGTKVHFHDFEAMLRQTPGILNLLAPVTFISMDRANKLAQAVSLAMALQTDAWTSLKKSSARVARYDKDLISKCLEQNEQQELSWQRWFETNDIEPFRVTYEELTADRAGVVRGIIELLGAENDEPDEVPVPRLEKQGDETNEEWIERFKRETKSNTMSKKAAAGKKRAGIKTAVRSKVAADRPAAENAASVSGEHVFDRFDRVIRNTPMGQRSVTGAVDSIRMRRRYDAIVGANRAIFEGARVLDIQSFDGRWCLAALDAGATHVTGVEVRQKAIESAEAAFTDYGVDPGSYEFVSGKILAALNSFRPGTFDVILCRDTLGQTDPRLFFHHLQRLKPKHVVLDATIARGQVPMATFKLDSQRQAAGTEAGRFGALVAVPNHELLALLCDCFGFRWREIDWKELGIADWTGLHDYERGHRRTYVLDLADGADQGTASSWE